MNIDRRTFLYLVGGTLSLLSIGILSGCEQSEEDKYEEVLNDLWLAKFTYGDGYQEYRVVGLTNDRLSKGYPIENYAYEISENLADTIIPSARGDYPNVIYSARTGVYKTDDEPFTDSESIQSDEPITQVDYIVKLKDQIFYLTNHNHENKNYTLSEIEDIAQKYIEKENLEKLPFYKTEKTKEQTKWT